MIRRRQASARAISATMQFYRDAAVGSKPSIATVLERVAEARQALDRLILEDHNDSLDLRIYHGAQLLDDAAAVLGDVP